jgi:hypothetical protein
MKVAMMVGDTVAVEAGDILVEVEVEVEDAIIVERKGILRETVLMLVTSERICRWFQSMITRLWCFSVILLWVVAFPRFSDCFFIPPPPLFFKDANQHRRWNRIASCSIHWVFFYIYIYLVMLVIVCVR